MSAIPVNSALCIQPRLDAASLPSAVYIAAMRAQARVTVARVPLTLVLLGFRRFSMTWRPFTSRELAARSSFLERYNPALLLTKVCEIQRASVGGTPAPR